MRSRPSLAKTLFDLYGAKHTMLLTWHRTTSRTVWRIIMRLSKAQYASTSFAAAKKGLVWEENDAFETSPPAKYTSTTHRRTGRRILSVNTHIDAVTRYVFNVHGRPLIGREAPMPL